MDLMYPPSPLTELVYADLRRRRSEKWQAYPADVLPMWLAEMDTALAPPIRDALTAAVALGDCGYVHPGMFAEAYCEFALARFGWVLDPASCRVIGDIMGGATAVLEQITAPGDEVVLTPPVYPPFFIHLALAGRRVVECPLTPAADGDLVLDVDRLADAFARPTVTAALLCNPHNPTGLVLSRGDLLTVARLADEHNVRILMDEIHSPLVYAGAVHVPFLSLADEAGAAARGFAFVSASKAWNVPGLKAALAVAGPDAAAELARLPHEVSLAAGIFGVLASEVAFREGGAWLDALLVGLDVNRVLLAELLAQALPEIGYRPPSATYLAWLDCRSLGTGDDPARTFLDHGRVALMSGLPFGTGGSGFARLNFATPPELLAEGVVRMLAALPGRTA